LDELTERKALEYHSSSFQRFEQEPTDCLVDPSNARRANSPFSRTDSLELTEYLRVNEVLLGRSVHAIIVVRVKHSQAHTSNPYQDERHRKRLTKQIASCIYLVTDDVRRGGKHGFDALNSTVNDALLFHGRRSLRDSAIRPQETRSYSQSHIEWLAMVLPKRVVRRGKRAVGRFVAAVVFKKAMSLHGLSEV
jgi:hypothetical protein